MVVDLINLMGIIVLLCFVFIILLLLLLALPFLWHRNNPREIKQNESKGACSNGWTERTRQGLAPGKEMLIQHRGCELPKFA